MFHFHSKLNSPVWGLALGSYIYIYETYLFPKQCLHYGVLTYNKGSVSVTGAERALEIMNLLSFAKAVVWTSTKMKCRFTAAGRLIEHVRCSHSNVVPPDVYKPPAKLIIFCQSSLFL